MAAFRMNFDMEQWQGLLMNVDCDMELLYLYMWLCLVTIKLYYHLLGYKMYGTYFTKAKCPVSQLLLFYRQGIMNQCSRFKHCFFKCLLLNQICTFVGVQHREYTLFPKTSFHMATVGSFSPFYVCAAYSSDGIPLSRLCSWDIL